MLKLNNLENQEQKELLEATLKELASDDLWDENNSIERTKQDMTKWTKKHGVPLLDMDSGPSASIQLQS